MQIVTRVILRLLAACLFAVMVAAPCFADDLRLEETKIKAGLLYNFLKYTEWPATTAKTSGLHICLYGGDPFAGTLSSLDGKTAQQSRISVSTVYTLDHILSCNAIIIDASAESAVPDILRFAEENSILTFSDMPGFAKQGGMVEFARRNERIQIVVNTAAANSARLQISPRLLKLALAVGGRP